MEVASPSAAATVWELLQPAYHRICVAAGIPSAAIVRWSFNQPCHRSSVAGVLHQLSFRRNFNQPVGGVERLASIQHLSFGS